MRRLFQFLATFFVALTTFGVTSPTIVQGISGVLTGNSDRPLPDFKPGLMRLDPNQTPFTNFLLSLPTRKVVQPVYNLFQDYDIPQQDYVNFANGYNSSDTSIVVDHGAYFGSGSLGRSLKVMNQRTREIFTVTSVSTNTLTIVRGSQYGTTSAAMLDNDGLLILGWAMTEGDTLPPIQTTQPLTVTNNTQIFREAFGVTGTDLATTHRGNEEDWSRNMKMAAAKIKRQVEYAIRFQSTRQVGGTAPATERTTCGFEGYAINQFDARGSLSKPDFETWMNILGRYRSSNEWVAFCGRNSMAQIDSLGYEGIVVPKEQTSIGMAIKTIEASFGTIHVIKDHTLSGGFADRIHLVDKANASLAELRPFQMLDNRQANDYDGKKAEFLWEPGFDLSHPETHGVVFNVGGPATSV